MLGGFMKERMMRPLATDYGPVKTVTDVSK